MHLVATTTRPARIADRDGYTVEAVRWPVLDGVDAEGLLLQPRGRPIARIVALPDADWTPEMLAGLEPGIDTPGQFARRLAENGCQVLIPVLIDRRDTWSGNPKIRMTNQPHREFIYRMAFEMGRHIIGYEVQKALAAVDWFEKENSSASLPERRNGRARTEREAQASARSERAAQASAQPERAAQASAQSERAAQASAQSERAAQASASSAINPPPIGVIGYGEGGLIAFYAGALDTRIDAVCVSGYFQSRQGVWAEPIYRNVWGLLDEFGDAEIASLIAPRSLIIEASRGPRIDGPPPAREGRTGAAPGRLVPPSPASVQTEYDRARTFYEKLGVGAKLTLVLPPEGDDPENQGSRPALTNFLGALGYRKPLKPAKPGGAAKLAVSLKPRSPADRAPSRPEEPATRPAPRWSPAAEARLHRQFDQLVEYTQRLVRESPARRREFWSKADASSLEKWLDSCKWYRDYLWDEIIGRCEPASLPANARTRRVYDMPKWTGYEVMLDVWPDVFAYGILLVPKDLRPGERRPVVVCQHGLEGRAQVICDPAATSPFYHAFGAQLADRGFIVYAPQNPYIGDEAFRVIQRKANPLKRSLFSVIVRQHEQTLTWLATLPFVDPQRIALYGLSYGGKTAMRVPALLPQYCLSICSGDFNEWIGKMTSLDLVPSYMFVHEYEMYEFDMGNTFDYAEIAGLIAPRPFMVERGHYDPVGTDEMVAWEYARVRRLYVQLGIGDRTAIEFFNGRHEIHGVGTFEFLGKHLHWPE
ncbi:MAG TPA: hypothetical protein PLC79_06860 [Phycisphaerae bacterium]|nr:hypothetical protein [Phycisphaerae bacterium]